jgi:hypothetical protein
MKIYKQGTSENIVEIQKGFNFYASNNYKG